MPIDAWKFLSYSCWLAFYEYAADAAKCLIASYYFYLNSSSLSMNLFCLGI